MYRKHSSTASIGILISKALLFSIDCIQDSITACLLQCSDSTCALQESRDSLGLHLKGSIIVVDEAHNLVDAVNGTHCAEVSINQLNAAETQLTGYFKRFRTRLASGVASTFWRLRGPSASALFKCFCPALTCVLCCLRTICMHLMLCMHDCACVVSACRFAIICQQGVQPWPNCLMHTQEHKQACVAPLPCITCPATTRQPICPRVLNANLPCCHAIQPDLSSQLTPAWVLRVCMVWESAYTSLRVEAES